MQENNNQTLWQIIKSYFNVLPYKDGEKYVIKQVTNGINFQGSNLWILIFAVFIASLGLNVNSTAVIIGAMLISPLMGPIIGMGLALGIADLDLFKQSKSAIPIANPIPMIGPINGEINIAPIITAVEFTFRPNEAIKMAQMSIQRLAP